jgi:hypothetical protein
MQEIAPERQLLTGFFLLSKQQHHGTVLPEAHAGNWTPKLLPSTGLVLLRGKRYHRTAYLEASVGNQALECPLPTGSVLLSQQQLLWLLEAHAPMQEVSRASAAWWAPDDSSLLDLLPHRYPQLTTQF